MRNSHLRLSALLSAILLAAPAVAQAQSTNATPKPKISVPPKTIRAAKYKQDTMIKRSQRHPEATGGNTAASENPDKPAPNATPTPH